MTLNNFINKIFKDRYKYFKGYKSDRLIFIVGMWVIFGFLLFVANSYNFDLNYYECVEPATGEEFCPNPFYKEATWQNAELLPVGEYGTKLGPLFKSMPYVVVGIFLLMFLLNHLIYNKGKNPFKGLKGRLILEE